MAKVNICNVEVLDNPASFFDPFRFQITFECYEPLDDDLEWKLVYVSSAYNASLDQTLDSILVGPVPVGRHQFLFEAEAPDPKRIPSEDIVGVTVVLIQALYRDKEFLRVGYYVNNEYRDEDLRLEPPTEPILDQLRREIIADHPRVTRFPIDWGDGLLDGCPEPEQNDDESTLMNADDDRADTARDQPMDGDQDDDDDDDVDGTDEPSENRLDTNAESTNVTKMTEPQSHLSVGSFAAMSGAPLQQMQASTISVDQS